MNQKKNIWKLALLPLTFLFLLLMNAMTALAGTYPSNLVGNCEPYYYFRSGMDTLTVAGDTYTDCIWFDTYNKIDGEACLDLDGNYVTFSFVSGSIKGKQDRTLTLEADGKVIYERVVGYNEVMKASSVSVQGVKQLTIRVSGSSSTFKTILGNVQLTCKAGYIKNHEPIASNFLQNCQAYEFNRYKTGQMKMGNQIYANCLMFDSYNSVLAEASFNLKNEYKSLSFLVGSEAGNNKKIQPRTVTIEADGTKIYEQVILNDEVPKAGSVNVNGVYQLTIKVSGSPSTFDTVLGKMNLVSSGKVCGITLNQSTLLLTENNPAAYLKASITPPDATNTAVIWTSSNPSIASVSGDGLVKGLKSGTTMITAKTVDGGYEAACQVTVDFPIHKADQSISASDVNVTVGKKIALKVLHPVGDGALSFVSSNKNVAVIDPASGRITGKKPGTATITVSAAETANYKAAVIKVKVVVSPKNVTLNKPKNNVKGRMDISWKKSSSVTGYQVQYSTKSNFTGAKTKSFNRKTASWKVKGLKKNTTYYVRIRTYKTSGKTKYYSAWSSPKSVKITK